MMQAQNPIGKAMAKHSDFSEKQVVDSIRAGLKEGRRPARMSAGRAAERAQTHRSIRARFQDHAQQSLSSGDYLQAAEKSWGAYAQTVKAIVADRRLRATHHASIIGVADRLAQLVGTSDPVAGHVLSTGLAFARSLHQHFYEDDLSDETVIANSNEVIDAIDLMQELFEPESSA